jgi:cell division protein FtsB
MRIKKSQKKFIKVLSSKVFLFCLLFLFAGLVKITVEKYMEVQSAKATLDGSQERIQSGETKNKKLKETLKHFQSKEYVESIAKEKLNLVRPGEKVIYVLPAKKKPAAKDKSSKNFWDSLKAIFGGDKKK